MGAYPPIWFIIAEILTRSSAVENKNTVWNFSEGFDYLWKRDGSNVTTFGPTLTHLFLLKMAKIKKTKQQCGKTSAIELFKYVKMKSLSPLTFLGKIRLAFAIFGIFLPGNSAGSQDEEVESKFDKYYFIHTINSHLPVKKFGSNIFQFCGYQWQRTFQKNFNRFFSNLAGFLGTITTFSKKLN